MCGQRVSLAIDELRCSQFLDSFSPSGTGNETGQLAFALCAESWRGCSSNAPAVLKPPLPGLSLTAPRKGANGWEESTDVCLAFVGCASLSIPNRSSGLCNPLGTMPINCGCDRFGIDCKVEGFAFALLFKQTPISVLGLLLRYWLHRAGGSHWRSWSRCLGPNSGSNWFLAVAGRAELLDTEGFA